MIKFISGHLKAGAGALAAAVLFGSLAQAQDIRIGAMREGTSWYVFAATLEQMIEPVLGPNSVEVLARGGGVANPMVVQSGKAEIALSNVASAVWARDGNPVYEGASAPDIRALVGGLNDVYIGVIARKAFVDQMGTSDLEAILASGKPVRILMKPAGSSAVPAAHMILEALGSSAQKIKANGGDIVQLDTPQIPDVLRNGGADIYIDTVVKGHPTISEVALTTPMAFLDIPQKALDVMTASGMTAGTYGPWFDGQTSGTAGANLGTMLVAHASLDEEKAYLITKTLCENAEALAKSHAAWAQFKPETAWKPEAVGIELHPGAVRYFKERGWM